MHRLDLFTLDVVTVVITFVTGVTLWLASNLNRKVAGIKRCSLASFLLCLGFSLYPARLAIPGKLIILLPNVVVFAGVLCILDGIRAFRELPRLRVFYAVTTVLYLPAISYGLWVDDQVNTRVAVETFFCAIPTILAAWSMAWDVSARDRPVYWVTAAGFAINGVTMLFRTADAWNSGPRMDLFDGRVIDFVGSMTVDLAAISCTFGLSLATNLKLHRETEKLALYDSLTNLPNRRLFEERLEQAEKRAFESGQPLALVYCDLDDFKTINDTIGHEGGDRALKLVADRLRSVISADICLARVGGDEFLLLVENARSRDQMHALIDRVRTAVEGEVELLGQLATIRISCGLAIFPEDVGSASDLIRLADAAMYMMKQHGRFSPASEAAGV